MYMCSPLEWFAIQYNLTGWARLGPVSLGQGNLNPIRNIEIRVSNNLAYKRSKFYSIMRLHKKMKWRIVNIKIDINILYY